jgi:hypothetical protein
MKATCRANAGEEKNPNSPVSRVNIVAGGNMEVDPVRQQAHDLLDALPEEKLDAVRNLLELLVEPLSRSLANSPIEEEEITHETAVALERSRASLSRGEGISHEQVIREFGT